MGLLVLALVAAGCSSDEGDTVPVDSTSTSTTSPLPTSLGVTETTAEPPSGPTTTSAAPEGPSRGGSVVVGLGFVPSTLNELRAGGFAAERWIRELVRPAGYVVQPDGSRRPHLVTRDPTEDDGGLFIAEDGSFEVTWDIDPAARWSDGSRIVAADFSLYHEVVCPGADGVAFPGEFLDADPGQVRVRFPAPTASYREAVAHVMPSHAIDRDVVCFDDGITWPSSGPFVVHSMSGPIMELVRNPTYWRRDPATDERLPYLDSIAFRQVSDDEAGLLSTGSVDIVDGQSFIGPAAVSLPSGVALLQGPGPVWEFLTFQFGPDNRNTASLNRHLAFRQALVHALDRVALAEAVGWLPTDGLGGTGSPGLWADYGYDPAESRALLEDLCVELGRDCAATPPRVIFTTTSNAVERPTVAGLVADMWQAVGVDVELDLEDSTVFFGESAPLGTYDVGMWAWFVAPGEGGRLDLLGTFDPTDPGPDGRNWYRWGAPGSSGTAAAAEAMEDVLARLAVAADEATVQALLVEAERIIVDDIVVIPIATRPVAVVHSLTLSGPEPSAAPGGFLWNAEYWYRTTNE